jgi:putative transcriptional regulator
MEPGFVALHPYNLYNRSMRKFSPFVLAFFVLLTSLCLGGEGFYSTPTFQPSVYRYAQSELELSKGMFLVANRNLRDPNFSQTVVLLIDYSENGAVGLVINRPSRVGLSDLFPDLKGARIRQSTVFKGGPVAVNELFFILLSEKSPDESFHVFDSVYINTNPELLEHMDKRGEEIFRVYAGYAGWAPEQLELEISLGGWHVMHADVDSIFFKESLDVWPDLIYKSSAQWTMFNIQPIHD